MADLTPQELARLRSLTGDTNAKLYDLTDQEMQEEYDAAQVDYTASSIPSAFNVTIVYVLRRRLGEAIKWTDRSGENNSESRSQRWDHLVKLLDYYEKKFGLFGSGAVLETGTLDLGLDAEEDDE